MTYKDLIKDSKDSNVSEFDLFLLIKELLGLDKNEVISNLTNEIMNQNIFMSSYEKLKKHEPIAYILGQMKYKDLTIKVNKNVLIPREETMELISFFEKIKNLKILDLCTGSGIIALSLAADNEVWASDISQGALAVAKKNANINKKNINIVESNLFQNIKDKYDIIISNPPYLSRKTIIDKSVINYEPHLALFANEYGLAIIKKIINEHKSYIKDLNNYVLAIEIDPSHSQYLKSYCKDFNFEIRKDFKNNDRFLIIKEGNWDV